jgi:hypothetical protein
VKTSGKGMQVSDVLEVVYLLEASGIEVWLDGGWGVDALLGSETRPHVDLDIAIQHKDVPKLGELLHDKQDQAPDNGHEADRSERHSAGPSRLVAPQGGFGVWPESARAATSPARPGRATKCPS